jgi:hypothetical protein
MRALGLALAVLTLSLLAACGTSAPAPQAAAAAEATVTVTASPTVTAAPGTASLLGVCDHVREAFRDGTLPIRRQFDGIASELQGMIDVAGPAGARVVRPVQRAAEAVAIADTEANGRQFNRAYRQLGSTCKAVGSTAWNS